MSANYTRISRVRKGTKMSSLYPYVNEEELSAETIDKLIDNFERGKAWLDKIYPNWWRKINLDFLDMSDSRRCILGQLYGDYTHAWNKYRDEIDFDDYGFSVSALEDKYEMYAELEWLWIQEVEKRVLRMLEEN